MRWGAILLNSGSLQGLFLGLNEDLYFALEAKLDAIRVEVKIAMLCFFLLGWRSQRLDEESSKESNEESDGLTEEILFFGRDEGVNKTLGWKPDEVWSSFSN